MKATGWQMLPKINLYNVSTGVSSEKKSYSENISKTVHKKIIAEKTLSKNAPLDSEGHTLTVIRVIKNSNQDSLSIGLIVSQLIRHNLIHEQ